MSMRDTEGRAPALGASGVVHSFTVCVLGSVITVEAESRETLDWIDRHVFPTLGRESTPSHPADMKVRVAASQAGAQLIVDDVVVSSAGQPEALLRPLIDALDRALVERLTGLHAVHAGAVLLGEKALIFPGASHSGKSSLVAELLRRGAVCLSDEYALIDAEGRVHAYPRVLLLREGSAVQTPLTAAELQAEVAIAPAQVGWILALQYECAGSWSIQSVPQSTALLTLLQNTPHVLADRPAMVSAFQRVVERAACYTGTRAEAAEAVSHILRLASSC